MTQFKLTRQLNKKNNSLSLTRVSGPCRLALAISLACASLNLAHAATWTGGISNDWFDASNWAEGSVPNTRDPVQINDTDGPVLIRGGKTANSLQSYIGFVSGSIGAVTVTGKYSAWATSNHIVGFEGTGTLTVAEGAKVTTLNSGLIGYAVGSIGEVTVTGKDSAWVTSNLTVGHEGTGTLTVAEGAKVESSGRGGGTIGNYEGSTGTVTVTGIDSLWLASNLTVGNKGTGTLTVTDGATVTSSESIIGNEAGSIGTVTVTGTNSKWVTFSDLIVGDQGTGTLTVAEGAKVTTLVGGLIGIEASSIGNVKVTGADSAWEMVDSLFVGFSGTGTLTVADGATVTSVQSTIGHSTGSTGEVTVTGKDSAWNASDLTVGNDGTGTLTVAEGATVTSDRGFIGNHEGSIGEVKVTGDGSVWNTSDLIVGTEGTGMLTVAEGATVTSVQSTIGHSAGSTGAVTVTGDGSAWNTSELYVGHEDTGTLTVAEGATVTSGRSTIGHVAGSTGEVTVTGDGSTWNTSELYVGHHGTGTLTVAEGAKVTTLGNGLIGNDAGSIGSVKVTGADSVWDIAGGLFLGIEGTGTLTVADGATVTSGQSIIGEFVDSTGEVTVTGAGSAWHVDTTLDIGANGTGTLTVVDGGTVTVGDTFNLNGTLNVDWGSTQPAVTARAASISGTSVLNVARVSELVNHPLTVIQTAAPGNLTGDFGTINIGGSDIPVDYLTVTPLFDNQRYQLTLGLSWNNAQGTRPQDAHGTFTLTGAQETFNVGVVLADQIANADKGWDGVSLTKAGEGTLVLSADNTYTGDTTIQAGTLQLGEGGVSGSVLGDITNEGALVINRSNAYAYDGVISGSGTLTQQGSGSLILSQDQTYTGVTEVNAGALILNNGAQLTQTASVTVAEGATLGGNGGVGGDVINHGLLAVSDASGVANNRVTRGLANSFSVGGNLTNHGAISVAGATVGNTLVVAGDYIGNGGLLTFNTALGGDNSATDKLVVSGNTQGSTQVVVNNTLGGGAQTVNGIEIIRVGGQSEGQFTLANRVVAGAYEYHLSQGLPAQANGNWYLSSTQLDDIQTYRPEAGSYMANMAAANKMFNLRLADREGRAENTSLWLRQQGSRTTFHDTTGQSRTATNTYVVQGGGDVFSTAFTGSDRLGVGLMAAYGNSSSETGSNRSGYNSKGTVDGYSTGVYATWYQDAKTLNGLYVDSWMQYSWLDGEVKGEQLSNESYDLDGLSASVEAGYRMPVYQGENGHVFITPQAQVTWSGINADDHHEVNGTHVTSSGDNNVQTRLGVKVSRDGVSDADKGTDKLFTVYAEANWLNNSEQVGAVLDGVAVKQSGGRNLAELKLGTEGQVNKHLNLWTNVAQQLGDDGYSDTALTVGIQYRF